MGSFAKYRDTILKFSVTKTALKSKEENKEFENQIIDQALDKPVARKTQSKASKNEIFLSKLFHGLIELHSSLESLEAFEIYVKRFPYSNTSIKKSQYLRFIIESYLHEFYILKERTKAYIKTVERAYKADYRHKEYLTKTNPLFKIIPEIFDDLLKSRGVHVHQSRYTDTGLERLESLELLKTLGTEVDDIFAALYQSHYNDTRKKWKSIIQNKNKAVIKVIDIIFEVLYCIVCTKKGNVRYPKAKNLTRRLQPT